MPQVCSHGLRGTWSTLATDAGVSEHIVARAQGHTNSTVTKRHYIERGAPDRARTRRMMRVVQGGKNG